MAYCQKCGNQIEDNAEFCSKCGSKLKQSITNDVRAGMNQADLDQTVGGALIINAIIGAIAIGVWSKSWWVFGISLIVLLGLVHVKAFAIIIGVIASIGAGIISYFAITWIFESTAAGVVLGIIVALVVGGANMRSFEYIKSLDKK